MRIAARCCVTVGRASGAPLNGAIAGIRYLQRLQGGDMERLDIGKLADTVLLEPGKERACRPVIGHARVVGLDRGGEEIEKPF
jgi:hypothetical protein